MSSDSKQKEELNGDDGAHQPLHDETQRMLKRIVDGTMTQSIFSSFISKVNSQFAAYETRIEELKKCVAGNKPAAQKEHATDAQELRQQNQLVTDFAKLQCLSPKCKVLVEFYSQFLCIIAQNKSEQHSDKTVIHYSDIERIICVPQENEGVLFYAPLKQKVALKWRKQSMEALCFSFSAYDDDEDTAERTICNLNTSLPATLSGTPDTIFCRVMTDLSQQSIHRHDRKWFVSNTDKKIRFCLQTVIKGNNCRLYPLRGGILVTPKPLRFIPQHCIKYYEWERINNGLRYFDMNVVLYEEEYENAAAAAAAAGDGGDGGGDAEAEIKKKKKRSKNSIISLSMIPSNDRGAIDTYFSLLKIKCKADGQPSPARRRKKQASDDKDSENGLSGDDNDNEQGNEQRDSENEDKTKEAKQEASGGDDDFSDDDDEEYQVGDEDEDEELEDDDDDDDDEEEYEMDGDGDGGDASVATEDDSDIDMDELKDVVHNVKLVENGGQLGSVRSKKNKDNDDESPKAKKSRKPNHVVKRAAKASAEKDKNKNRKRRRSEMEEGVGKEQEENLQLGKNKKLKRRHSGEGGATVASKTAAKKRRTSSDSVNDEVDSDCEIVGVIESPQSAKKSKHKGKKRSKRKSGDDEMASNQENDSQELNSKKKKRKQQKDNSEKKKKKKKASTKKSVSNGDENEQQMKISDMFGGKK